MNITSRFLLLFVLSIFSLFGCQSTTKSTCGTEVRAAFDVGSGSTKMKVAEFNTCTHTLGAVLLEAQKRVPYQEDLEKGSGEVFSETIQSEGIEALRSLKIMAETQKATKFTGVATAAFRRAKNGSAFIERIAQDTRIQLHLITQEQEAQLGFKGAARLSEVPPAHLVLWDIGGGSQQMVTLDKDGKPHIYYGQVAAVTFKNHIVEKIQKRGNAGNKSPNPLTKKFREKSVAFAEKTARETVPTEIRQKILDSSTKVVGIGGVLSRSVVDQVIENKTTLAASDILKSLQKREVLTDAQIGGDYVQTEVTNLALVYGFMSGLKMKSYRPLRASLIDGLWLEDHYWQ